MVAKKKRKVKARKRLTKRKIVKRVIRKRVIKKKPSRKRAKKPAVVKRPAIKKVEGKVVGRVTHYFPKVMAGVVKMKAPLAIGDTIKIKGHTTDFTQTVASMQIDRVAINQAKKGQEIGLLVNSRVRQHDTVYKI